jgi:hypothetical protein
VAERIGILKLWSDKGLIKDFTVSETEISAQLGPNCVVRLNPDGLKIVVAEQETHGELVSVILALLGEQITPTKINAATCLIQYVVPLSGRYSEIRKRTTAGLFGEWWTGPADDYAVLITSEDGKLRTAQTEFGVVSKSEIPPRLLRVSGRMRQGASSDSAKALASYLSSELPAAALFADCAWYAKPGAVAPTAESIKEFIAVTRAETGEGIRGLSKRFREVLK